MKEDLTRVVTEVFTNTTTNIIERAINIDFNKSLRRKSPRNVMTYWRNKGARHNIHWSATNTNYGRDRLTESLFRPLREVID